MDRRDFIRTSAGGALAAAASLTPPLAGSLLAAEVAEPLAVRIETRQRTGQLAHVWEECAGSDRAAITLRESWRDDLDLWHREAGLKRVRFHGIFADELGVFGTSILHGSPKEPNFRNVFEVYDGLVARGVAPYVELSFMPGMLASGVRTFGFYKANITPPQTLEAWAAFITSFVTALIARYGLATVRQWPFEVWNEPNLGAFWSGTQAQYFDLYKATAVAIKAVDPKIQVGGPSTSSAQWIGDFLSYCAANNAPLDFVATHCYAGDRQAPLFGPGSAMPQYDVIPAAMAQTRRTIEASPFAGRPLWLSEWSSDSPAMIAHVIKGCLPHLQAMSHWALSGTYEELGVTDHLLKEGDNGYPAIYRGIARPNFNTYRLLHALGNEQLAADGPALASARGDGGVSALVWNLADVTQPAGLPEASNIRRVTGSAKRLDVHFAGARPGARARVRFVDQERGSPLPVWRAMGSPQLPTMAQIAVLRRAAQIAPAEIHRLDAHGALSLRLPPEGVALIELA